MEIIVHLFMLFFKCRSDSAYDFYTIKYDILVITNTIFPFSDIKYNNIRKIDNF